MIENLIDRYLGRFARVNPTADASITSLGTTAYSAGDVMNDGTAGLLLSCVSHAKSQSTNLTDITIWEKAATGSAIKPDLRIYIFDTDYVVAAQNSAFLGPADHDTLVGVFDIATGDWHEYDDGSDNFAIAHVKATSASVDGGTKMKCADGSRHLYAVCTTTGTPTFAADANLNFRFEFEQ